MIQMFDQKHQENLLLSLKTLIYGMCFQNALQCLCIENFEYTVLTKIETSVFPMHEYHIIFVLTGEKGVEISICFEALGANFDSHCVMS